MHTNRKRRYSQAAVATGDVEAARDAAGAIERTLIAAHFMISAAGLVFAASIALLVIGFGIEPFAANPGLSVVLMAVAGLLVGILTGSRYRATTSTSRGTPVSLRSSRRPD